MGYWTKVFKGAWDRTWRPLGWDRKKVAVGVTAIGTIVVALFHFGWAAMITTAAGLGWTIAPIAFAATILFAWGVFETQANLYKELEESSTATISELQIVIAKSKEPPPNYEAWRHVHEITLKKAAFLWCEVEPRMAQPPKVTAWLNALEAAVKKGELDFLPKYSDQGRRDRQRSHQQDGAWSETVVTRDHLKAFAKAHGNDPIFLRDAADFP
jgi:hypothetical protein